MKKMEGLIKSRLLFYLGEFNMSGQGCNLKFYGEDELRNLRYDSKNLKHASLNMLA